MVKKIGIKLNETKSQPSSTLPSVFYNLIVYHGHLLSRRFSWNPDARFKWTELATDASDRLVDNRSKLLPGNLFIIIYLSILFIYVLIYLFIWRHTLGFNQTLSRATIPGPPCCGNSSIAERTADWVHSLFSNPD